MDQVNDLERDHPGDTALGPASPSAADETGDAPTSGGHAPDVRSEARRLAAAAVAGTLPARLMGGLAVWLRCPAVRSGPYSREYRDIDLVAPARARKRIADFLESSGYVGDRLFNALHGARRLVYSAEDGYAVDVIFDELQMSHRLDLRDRLEGREPTLDLADLLLTKLQIWEINEKDLGDALCIVADHALAEGALAERGLAERHERRAGPGADRASDAGATDHADAIDVERIQAVLGADWGFCHTVERNLRAVRDLSERRPLPDALHDVGDQVRSLLAAIDAAPKSAGWRMRARVGERVRWYETPEEVRR